MDRNSGNLIIESAEESHSGRYSCLAKNKQGQVEATVYLTVAGKAQMTNGPKDQSVVIGSNVVFPCEVANGQSISRQWFFKVGKSLFI